MAGDFVFKIGDKVVYGQTGVCVITDICEKEFIRNKKNKYYVLSPLTLSNNVIYAPVEDPKVFMRHIITKEQADGLINSIPEIVENMEKTLESDKDGYREEINNHTLSGLVEITTHIYAKKKECSAFKKRLNAVDEKYMKIAENLLFGELSEVLEIPFEEVPKYIAKKIEK